MKLPYYLIDLDGTVIDSLEFSVQILNKVLRKYELPETTVEKYREAIDPSSTSIAKKLGIVKEEQLLYWRNLWKSEIENNHNSLRLYMGMDILLEKLLRRGHILSVITGNFRESALKNMQRFGIEKYFQNIIAYENVKNPKPHKEHFLAAMKIIGGDAKDIVFIEDMYPNIATAKRIGMKTIAVTWGYDTLKKLRRANPDFIANDIEELEKIIDEINLSFDNK